MLHWILFREPGLLIHDCLIFFFCFFSQLFILIKGSTSCFFPERQKVMAGMTVLNKFCFDWRLFWNIFQKRPVTIFSEILLVLMPKSSYMVLSVDVVLVQLNWLFIFSWNWGQGRFSSFRVLKSNGVIIRYKSWIKKGKVRVFFVYLWSWSFQIAVKRMKKEKKIKKRQDFLEMA